MAWTKTKYKGVYVFYWTPNWVSAGQHVFDHPYDLLTMLGVERAESNYGDSTFRLRAGFLGYDRETVQDINDFFDASWGRYRGFWLPSWHSDLVLTAGWAAIDTAFTAADIKWDEYWSPADVTGHHVLIRWPDGTFICREITSVVGGTTYNVNAAFGKACSAAEAPWVVVSFLYFVRFNQDEIEMKYYTTDVADIEFSFKTLQTVASTTTTSSSSSTTSSTA